ncbi:MAG: DUF4173 domain-containing protein [Akkermansiaceae bacterium]|nr:DUF4173 domain-containing protein [Akkermansiaceae bacterium]
MNDVHTGGTIPPEDSHEAFPSPALQGEKPAPPAQETVLGSSQDAGKDGLPGEAAPPDQSKTGRSEKCGAPSLGKSKSGASAPPPLPPKKRKKLELKPPSWWRESPAPLLALLMACYAMDCLTSSGPLGAGAALGVWLLALAVLVLRRDLSGGAVLLICVGSVLNAAGLVISGAWWCLLLGVLFLPVVLYLPARRGDDAGDVREKALSWWGYWFHGRAGHASGASARLLAWGLSLVSGVAIFAVFLNIFADGNPVVALVRDWLINFFGTWFGWLKIDWSILVQIYFWFFGFLLFGLLTFRRRKAAAPPQTPSPGRCPLLPAFPFILLFFINLAFLIVNSSDVAYLWRGLAPENISLTQYLYEGADSVMYASVLAGLILLVLFRARGSVRASWPGKAAAYVLMLQTLLLAASVALRLWHQIADLGFTPRRVLGIWLLAGGLIILFCLLGYMHGKGRLMRFAFHTAVVLFLGCSLAGVRTPTQMSGDLNMLLMKSFPHWKFQADDLALFKVRQGENVSFAIAVYQKALESEPAEADAIRALYGGSFGPMELFGLDGRGLSWRNYNICLRCRAAEIRRFRSLLFMHSPSGQTTPQEDEPRQEESAHAAHGEDAPGVGASPVPAESESGPSLKGTADDEDRESAPASEP